MNKIFSIIWSQAANAWVVVSEHGARQGKSGRTRLRLVVGALGAAPLSLLAADLPQGGQVTLGSGTLSTPTANHLQVQQASQKLAIDWQSFDIGADSKVTFQQPGSDAIALNRVVGSDGSKIMGQLDANGRVFLINPNGVLIGKGAQVNVGGLVASTLELSNEDFAAGNYRFKGDGSNASVVNQGNISAADGGAVALLGGKVSNEGVIAAKMGTVALAAGNQVTLDFAGDGLLNVQIDEATKDALVENHQLIQADGGQVLMTAKASDALLKSVVNNTGVIEAQTLGEKNGKIALLGGFDGGTVEVAGTLDASAPNGGNGGFIDTSGAHVQVKEGAKVTTQAAKGKTGSWLIDPNDYTIAASGGDISGAQLSSNLSATNVTLQSSSGAKAGNGDIFVNDVVSWSANKLTLSAERNIEVKANLNGSGTASLALEYGQAAVASGNLGTYNLAPGVQVNLPAGPNFSTRLGSDGVVQNFTVLTTLGSEGSTTTTDLQGVRGNLAGNYVLGSDIDAQPTHNWMISGYIPLGDASTPFTGTFDGLGHTVSNITSNDTVKNNRGMFGVTGATAVIRNVNLVDAYFVGLSVIGTLAGENNGKISNSSSTASKSCAQISVGCLFGGNGAYSFVGGLVGDNNGTISNSYATVNAQGSGAVGGLVGSNYGKISNSYALGNLQASAMSVGGLVGDNRGTISNSYAGGNVWLLGTNSFGAGGLVGYNDDQFGPGSPSPGIVSNSYAYGKVSGGTYATNLGGLIGVNNAFNTVTNSYWDVTTSGQSSSPWGGTGLTTSQMQQQSSFSNWDFANTWIIYNGNTYPLLRSFMTPVTVTANGASKTYDGLAYSGGNGVAYSNPGASLLGTLSYGGSAQNARNAGTYAITPGGLYSTQQGYAINFVDGALTISPRALSISGLTANNKTYDGNTTATVNTAGANLAGLVAGDQLSVSATGTFADKNVGTGKSVTLRSTYSGADLGNYAITDQTGTTADINPAAVTLGGIRALNKVYDGATRTVMDFTGMTVNGLLVGDSVTLGGLGRGDFVDKNVGDGKAVTVSGYALSGTDAGNYVLRPVSGVTASITPAALSLSGIMASSKTYDGTTIATVNSAGAVYTGLLGGDVVSVNATGTFADKNVGNGKSVALRSTYSGADAGNYTITDQAGTTANITPAALSVSGITASNKTYDGTTVATINTAGASLAGLVAGDQLSVSAAGAFADKNVGNGKSVALRSTYSGADLGNYTITDQANTRADITPAALRLGGITTANKVYDGTTAATLDASGVTFSGLLGGDVVSLSGAGSGAFADKNVGNGKAVTVTGYTLLGADAGNYLLAQPSGLTANITPAEVTLGGIRALNKLYDGMTRTVIDSTGMAVTGLLGGDSVTLSGLGRADFLDKNAGDGKAVTISGYSLSGTDAGNYVLLPVSGVTASITPAALTIGGITASNKVYDGTTAAMVNTAGATFTGLVAGDSVTVSATGAFADKNVGNGKSVALRSTYGGADVGNYFIFVQPSTTANITPKALALTGITASNKVYDGTTVASLNVAGFSFIGLVGSDTVSLGGAGIGSFADKNVGTGKTVTVSGYTLGVIDGSNYSLLQPTGLTADITPASVTLGGIKALHKVYDGATRTFMDFAGMTVNGLLVGDSVTLGGLGRGDFVDKNVGDGKVVTVSGYALSGTDAGNYLLRPVSGVTASITPAALTVSGLTANNKVYDGTTVATVNTAGANFAGLLAGDQLGVSATGTFADKNVGSGKAVALRSTYSGADAGNYIITDQAGSTADITPRSVTVTANGGRSSYGDSGLSNPGLSATGLANGESVAVLAGLSNSFGITPVSAAGTYLLAVQGSLSNGNYVLSQHNDGTWVVEPKAVVIDPKPDMALTKRNLLLDEAYRGALVSAHSSSWPTSFSQDNGLDNNGSLYIVENSGIRLPEGGAVLPSPITCDPHAAGQSAGCPRY